MLTFHKRMKLSTLTCILNCVVMGTNYCGVVWNIMPDICDMNGEFNVFVVRRKSQYVTT